MKLKVKTKKPVVDQGVIDEFTLSVDDNGKNKSKKKPLIFGRRTAKDLIAVDIDRTGADYLKVGEWCSYIGSNWLA